MAAIRRASAVWEGALLSGSGTVSAGTSGKFHDLPVSWGSRTEAPGGRTSPEELLAAAHASCFLMALSNNLAKAGTPAERLEGSAEVTFDQKEGGWAVVSSALTVRGKVPNADAEAFKTAADGAKEGCPISKALKGNVEITVDASLKA
jgi:lipoyl-dependent peroxiredoxin